MIDKNALSNELRKAFIHYQQRLDCPMPSPMENEETLYAKYRNDPIFHAKVNSLLAGVMRMVAEHDVPRGPAEEEIQQLKTALRYAIDEADGWYDEQTGKGWIKSKDMDDARSLLK